jgi:hypothetical protein
VLDPKTMKYTFVDTCLSDREIAALYADKVLVRDPALDRALDASTEPLINDAH